jgi:hypothetical protein
MTEKENDDLVDEMEIIYNLVYEQTCGLLQNSLEEMANKMLIDLRRSRIGDNAFIHGIKQK